MLHEKLVDIHVYYMSYKHQWLLYFLCLVHHKYSMSTKEKILNMIRSIQINLVLFTEDLRVENCWVLRLSLCKNFFIKV